MAPYRGATQLSGKTRKIVHKKSSPLAALLCLTFASEHKLYPLGKTTIMSDSWGGATMLLVAVRALILYVIVVIVMRVMGKRQVGDMQPFELSITILIAELAAVPMADTGIPITNGIVAILVLLVAEVVLSVVTLHSEQARSFICGRPAILVAQGKLVPSTMRQARVNMSDLMEQLRTKNYPDIADVHYAILETNGSLSVIPKGNSRPPVAKELGVVVPDPMLPITLILDGDIHLANMKKAGITVEQLESKAKEQEVADLRDVFFAQLNSSGQIDIQVHPDVGGESI